jgi:raffinose/stachyose/melibiose transport system substrate-binding protein
MGMNAAPKKPEAARAFLDWIGSSEFASIYANRLPGFFSLSNHDVAMENPMAQEFVSWRGECSSTIRLAYQILSRGTPNLENDTWNASAQVIKGAESPEDAGARLQAGLASWYAPHQ